MSKFTAIALAVIWSLGMAYVWPDDTNYYSAASKEAAQDWKQQARKQQAEIAINEEAK